LIDTGTIAMDIDEIRTFVSIAQLGGFTRAAGRLNRSQPAISRRIGLIEQDLGAALVERVRGGAKLTEAGRAFLPFAEAVLAAIAGARLYGCDGTTSWRNASKSVIRSLPRAPGRSRSARR
jgi:DNA-binding transcriptional LysR family regulator